MEMSLFGGRSSDLGVNVEFADGGKPEHLEKNPRSQIEIDKSQTTCGAQDSIPGHRGGRRDLTTMPTRLFRPKLHDTSSITNKRLIKPLLVVRVGPGTTPKYGSHWTESLIAT